MDDEQLTGGPTGGDEELLKEIREKYTYFTDAWKEIREERQIDIRYLCGDPWDDADKKARKAAGRPCISHDELNQYVIRAVNNARQNKRGIKVDPIGDSTAAQPELRQDIIRTAEYRGRAQACYLTAYQAMLEGSYGFFGISRRYVENENITAKNFSHQEFTFRTFSNPDSVLPDPDCKEPDWSDQTACFVLDPISREEFKRRYPTAEIRDFSSDQMLVAKDWLSAEQVLVAEFWKVEKVEETVYVVGGKITTAKPKGDAPSRTRTKKTVVQYITNGIEILKANPQPGTIIPIIPVTGLERYVDTGEGPKRKLFSLVRLARDPQMTLAYLASQELEESGLSPKSPYMGYVGQFETDAVRWENLTKQPVAFIQVDPTVDGVTGEVLPLPTRVPFTPNFQQYEVAKDSARRAIQAAMGINALPTAAQRNNEKSGVALQTIQSAQDVGSFHFVDGFDRALMVAGRIMNEQMGVVYGDEDRDMMLTKADDKQRRVRLNTAESYTDPDTGQQQQFLLDDGTQTVTVSTGPSQDSQHQAVSDFVDSLLQNLKNLPIPPPVQAKILAVAIQMKQLGPKGDQLAELISPDTQGQPSPQEQQAIALMNQHQQQATEMIQELQGELGKLKLEKAGHVIQGQFDMEIEKLKLENALAVAEISTKAQTLSERVELLGDMMSQFHQQAHDAAMQADQQDHAQQMQASGAQQAQEQQAQGAQQSQAAADAAQQAQPDQQAA